MSTSSKNVKEKRDSDHSVNNNLKKETSIDEGSLQNFKIKSTDDLLNLCGGAGKWQLRVFFLTFLCGFPAAFQDFLYIFIAATPEYTCQLPECPLYTRDELKNISIPGSWDQGKYQYEQCSKFIITDNYTCEDLSEYIIDNRTESCNSGYAYDDSMFNSTIVSEWNLVCGYEFMTSTAQAIYGMGSLTGSLVFGIVSDNFGRKKAVAGSLLMSVIFGPVVALAPNYTVFLISRFFLATGSPGIYDITHILVMESIGVEWRGFVGNAFGVPYALGYSGLGAIAYLARDWRRLQLILVAPPFLFLLILYFVPESPRWLISQGKAKEAEKIFREIASSNNKEDQLPKDLSDVIKNLAMELKPVDISATPRKSSIRKTFSEFFTEFGSLFRTPRMRRRTLVLNFCWFSTVLVYFGVALNAPNLSANLFMYTILSGLLEIPSYLIVPPLISWFGRKFVFAGLLFTCGTALSLSMLFEPGTPGIIALALIGMFHIGSTFSLIFLYGTELMPTQVRTYGIGFAALTSKIGYAGAPYITLLLGKANPQAPNIVFAVFCFVASVLALLLPETRNTKLPETVDEVENLRP